MGAGDQAEPVAVEVDLPGVLAEPLQHRADGPHVIPRDEPDAIAARAGLGDGEPVARAAQLEVDRAAALVLHMRAPAVRGGQQPLQLDLLPVPVGLDRRGRECDTGVLVRHQPALGADPVDPAGVRAAVDDRGLVEQVDHEALVRGAALDEDGRLPHRATQPGQCLVTRAAVGDDLGDHRVEVGRDLVALAHAGVDPDARASGQVEQRDAARGGREVAVGILGVEPRLNRVPPLGGLRAGQLPARGHVQLGLDEVHAGGGLGDRVLDLQAGVHLEEGEQLLHGAVPHAQRPRGALAVGDHLNLDVPGAGNKALKEHHTAAERTLGLQAGALVGVGEILGTGDDADAAATSARGRLEHQRVADPLGRAQRRVEVLHGAPAPRRDRDAELLGDQLGADLVAQLAHRAGVRADERHTQLLA